MTQDSHPSAAARSPHLPAAQRTPSLCSAETAPVALQPETTPASLDHSPVSLCVAQDGSRSSQAPLGM